MEKNVISIGTTSSKISESLLGQCSVVILRSIPNAIYHFGENCYQAIATGNDGNLYLAIVRKINNTYNTIDSDKLSVD